MGAPHQHPDDPDAAVSLSAFSAANATSLLLFFGMFGAIFLLTQFLQLIRGYSPLEAGLRTLPWTGMLVLVGPVAGALSDRIGSRPLVVAGMTLLAAALAWLAAVVSPAVPYVGLGGPFLLGGVGMSLFFAPTANAALLAVERAEEGKASGILNTIRQLGGVLGVAVLAAVFSAVGSYASPQAFVDGLTWALWTAAAVVGLGTLTALGLQGRKASFPRPPRDLPNRNASQGAAVAHWTCATGRPARCQATKPPATSAAPLRSVSLDRRACWQR